MPTYSYTPTPTPLTQEELDLLAAEQQAMGGYVPAGGYVAEPVPPPSIGPQAAPPPAAVPSPGLGSGSAYNTAPPPTDYVPPPPPSGQPTWDFLAPLGQARDAAVASPVGQAVGGVMSTPLPFADRVDVPPPTAVGGHLSQGRPGAAAQLVGDVAGRDPLTTASLLIGGPVLGALGRGAIPIARGIAAGGASRGVALKSLRDAGALAGTLGAIFGPVALVGSQLGNEPSTGVPAPAPNTTGTGGAVRASPAAPTSTGTTSTTTGAPRTTSTQTTTAPSGARVAAPSTPSTTTPAGTTGAPGTAGTGGRPASSPLSSPAATTVPANVPAASIPTASAPTSGAPARTLSAPPSGTTDATSFTDFLGTLGRVDTVQIDAEFRGADFEGHLADLPGLGAVSQSMADRMARIANGRLRRRRASRDGAFTMERGALHRLISESVYAALRGAR